MTDKDITKLNGRFDTLFENLNILSQTLEERFTKIDTRFDGVDARFDKVEADLKEFKGASLTYFDQILSRLTALEEDRSATFAWLRRHEEKLEEHDKLLQAA